MNDTLNHRITPRVTWEEIRALPKDHTFTAAHAVLMERKKKHARDMRKATGLSASELTALAFISARIPKYVTGEWDILNKDSRRDGLGVAMETTMFKLQARGLLRRGGQRYSVADFMSWKGRPKTRHHFWDLTDAGWQWFAEFGRYLGEAWDYEGGAS